MISALLPTPVAVTLIVICSVVAVASLASIIWEVGRELHRRWNGL